MKKIVHVVFSTNRLEFLKRTFESQKKFDYSGVEVHKLFIDDYPNNRDDELITNFAKSYGYNEIILHNTNRGITVTWQELFNIVKERDYDYILHQEDDVELLQPLKVLDLVEILESNKNLSQVQLKRNNWYPNETTPIMCQPTDIVYKKYRYEFNSHYFWMLMSLYPTWIAKLPFLEETKCNPSEFTIAHYLFNKYRLGAGLLKSINGENLVHHFGDYSQGKRVAPGEPGWDRFCTYDPNLKYCSKTGILWHENKFNSNQ